MLIKYNTKNTKHIHTFRSFYRDYIEELSQYSPRLQENPVTLNELYDIDTNPLLKRYFITDTSNIPIGFILLGFGENTQPGTDWYIAEFYIQPSARKQGNGKRAVKEMLQTHPGKYCYFVLKENKRAYAFWTKLREEFECNDIKNNYICMHTPEDCIFEAFEYAYQNEKKEGNIEK